MIRNTPLSTSVLQPQAASLEDQKLIDSARDILMHQRDLSAEQAYRLLAEMASKRKTGIADISLQLVNVTKRLTT